MNDDPSILRVLALKAYDSLPEEEKARCRADPEYAKKLAEKMGGAAGLAAGIAFGEVVGKLGQEHDIPQPVTGLGLIALGLWGLVSSFFDKDD